jgi:hypothetical protein
MLSRPLELVYFPPSCGALKACSSLIMLSRPVAVSGKDLAPRASKACHTSNGFAFPGAMLSRPVELLYFPPNCGALKACSSLIMLSRPVAVSGKDLGPRTHATHPTGSHFRVPCFQGLWSSSTSRQIAGALKACSSLIMLSPQVQPRHAARLGQVCRPGWNG